MDTVPDQTEARRRFLRMLVASPLAPSNLLRISLTNFLGTGVIAEKKAFTGPETSQQTEDVLLIRQHAKDLVAVNSGGSS